MANYKLIFNGTKASGTEKITIECFANTYNEISIVMDDVHIIALDISTAIKFAKTLRTEINKAKEVSND